MPSTRLHDGIRVGLVAAAATAGALIGFGFARATPFHPINTVAHLVLGSRAFLFEAPNLLVTSLGAILHVASVIVWGVLFTLIAGRLTGAMLWAAAIIFTGAAAALDLTLLPDRLRPGFERVLTTTEIAGVYVVLAASLALGVLLLRARDDLRRRRDTVSLQNATSSRRHETDPLA